MNAEVTEVAMTTLEAMSQVPENFTATEIKNFYENILTKLPCIVFWKDKYFKYVFCNEVAAFALLKLSSPDEIVGKTDFDFGWNIETAKWVRQTDEEILRTGKPLLNREVTLKRNEGRMVHLSTNRMPLFDRLGEVIGIIGIGVDITAQKEAEQREAELRKLEKEHQQATLQEKEKLITLACKVAHDINSPVAALRMMIDSYEELHEEKRSFLRRATESILDIANNLISNYQKEENATDAGTELPQLLLVSDLLIQLVSEKKVQYQQHSVTFKTVITQEAQFAFIQVQKSGLRRSLSNLINNAVDASENKKNGKVTIQLTADADVVVVEILDNGKGMSSGMLEKIQHCRSFTEGKEHGHGLGLQQVWDMLECNQGSMEVQSTLAKGSSIQLAFSRTAASEWIAQAIHLIPDNIVVILDDDESIHTAWDLRFIPLIASYPALRVHHFTHGQEALDFLGTLNQEQKNHVVFLSDYELLQQDRNGLQIIEASGIRQAILVTSYYSSPHVQEAAERLGIKLLPKQMASVIPIHVE